ncbi:MAG TPA: hypothetical protein VIF34_13150 [Methylocystis sp.]|jgi:hypothetical protein
MFIVSSTRYGISQRPIAYPQLSDAIARAAIEPATTTDKSQIYQVAEAADPGAAVSAVSSGKGVFIDALERTSPTPVAEPQGGGDAAKAQIAEAMTSALLAGEAKEP